MTYLEELKTRYKEARKRMQKHAIPEPRPVRNLPQPMPLPEEAEKGPGLVSEKAERDIVCNALKITSIEGLDHHSQIYRMADELLSSPRLPPLPGLVLNEMGAIRWLRVLHAVAKQHNVTPAEIRGKSRKRHVINARFEVFYRLRTDLAMSYTKIGIVFGKDHTTVLHGVNKLRQKLLDEIKKPPDDHGPRLIIHLDQRGADPTNLSAA